MQCPGFMWHYSRSFIHSSLSSKLWLWDRTSPSSYFPCQLEQPQCHCCCCWCYRPGSLRSRAQAKALWFLIRVDPLYGPLSVLVVLLALSSGPTEPGAADTWIVFAELCLVTSNFQLSPALAMHCSLSFFDLLSSGSLDPPMWLSDPSPCCWFWSHPLSKF